MNNTDHFKSFHYLENGTISFSTFDTIQTTSKLLTGVYELTYIDYPKFSVEVKKIETKERKNLHIFPEKETLDTIFSSYFQEETTKLYQNLGFIKKIGVLLYGKEGTGKSSILRAYYHSFSERQDALVFYIATPRYLRQCWEFITKVRAIQSNPIVIFLDEFDEFFKFEGAEGLIKSILDGYLSINNCIVLATTNYIDQIPQAVKRQSRFKYVLEIEGLQTEEQITPIINDLLSNKFSAEEKSKFVDSLKGSTLDEIKHFCLDKLLSIKTLQKAKRKIGF